MRITKCGLHKWTENDEDALIHAVAIGMSTAKIAELFEVDESAIKAKLKAMATYGKIECGKRSADYKKMNENNDSDLPMTDEEIRTLYRDAKNKKQQITILSELNACNKKRIRNILGLEEKR